MQRKEFFKKLFQGAIAVVTAPTILANLNEPTNKVDSDWHKTTGGILDFIPNQTYNPSDKVLFCGKDFEEAFGKIFEPPNWNKEQLRAIKNSPYTRMPINLIKPKVGVHHKNISYTKRKIQR